MSAEAYSCRAVLVDLFVPGSPGTAGSKHGRPIYRGKKGEPKVFTGKVAMVESAGEKTKTWREDIRQAVLHLYAGRPASGLAMSVTLEFVLRRPLSTPKTFTPPAIKKPDQDKLTRAVFDAITSTGCVWLDDAQVTHSVVDKRLAEIGEATGCRIRIEAG